jgi:hypothetical protein
MSEGCARAVRWLCAGCARAVRWLCAREAVVNRRQLGKRAAPTSDAVGDASGRSLFVCSGLGSALLFLFESYNEFHTPFC